MFCDGQAQGIASTGVISLETYFTFKQQISILVCKINNMQANKFFKSVFVLVLSVGLIACSSVKKSEQEIVDELNNRMHEVDEQLIAAKVYSPLHVSAKAKELLKAKADSVIELVKLLRDEYPENKELANFLFQAGSLSTMMDYHEDAIEFYDDVVTNHSDFQDMPEVLYLRGYQYRELKEFDKAKESFNDLIKNYPTYEYNVQIQKMLNSADFENIDKDIDAEINANMNEVEDEINASEGEMKEEMEKANEEMKEEMEKANEEMEKLQEKMN